MPFSLCFSVGSTIIFYSTLTVLAVVAWQVLIVVIPMVYVTLRLQVMDMFFDLYCNSDFYRHSSLRLCTCFNKFAAFMILVTFFIIFYTI